MVQREGERGGYKKIIAEGGMLSLIVVLEIFQKIKGDGELDKNQVEKKQRGGGCDPQINYSFLVLQTFIYGCIPV